MSATYLDRAAVARSVELLTEIRDNYGKIIKQYPKSDSMGYYLEHVNGLNEAIGILQSTQTPRRTAV